MPATAYTAIKKQDKQKENSFLSLVKDSKGNVIDEDWCVRHLVRSVERSVTSQDESSVQRGIKLIADIRGFIKNNSGGKAEGYNRYTQIIQNVVIKSGEKDEPSPEQLQRAAEFTRSLPSGEVIDAETGEVLEEEEDGGNP